MIGASADTSAPSSAAVAQRYMKNYTFPFELIHLKMTQTIPGGQDKSLRILAAYHNFYDGSRGHLLRILEPEEVGETWIRQIP